MCLCRRIARRSREGQEEEEGEGETVSTRESIAKEDPRNAHQAQRQPKPRFDDCVASLHP